jgi:hypothetical protein
VGDCRPHRRGTKTTTVKGDDWFVGRPKRAPRYLEQELLGLRAAVTEATEQAQTTATLGVELTCFIHATEVRWSREDEEAFQASLVQWKKSIEPTELKVLRGLWKIFGAKTLELVTGPVPVEWDAAAAVAAKVVSRS